MPAWRLAGGGGIAWLAWLMLTRDHASISWYFLRNALPLGGGSNVVNVILVDFRGFDTFGEITVLAIAAVGGLALLDGMRVRRPSTDALGRAWTFAREPLDAADDRAVDAAAGAARQRLHLLARPQPAGRRIHCRTGHRGGAGAAVRLARPGPRRGLAARPRRSALHALGRQRPGDCRADRASARSSSAIRS